jgi:hypothetical protein
MRDPLQSTGRERVAEALAPRPARPGEGQGRSARATVPIPGGIEGRALWTKHDDASTTANERSE